MKLSCTNYSVADLIIDKYSVPAFGIRYIPTYIVVTYILILGRDNFLSIKKYVPEDKKTEKPAYMVPAIKDSTGKKGVAYAGMITCISIGASTM
jgi:hypothetical protein